MFFLDKRLEDTKKINVHYPKFPSIIIIIKGFSSHKNYCEKNLQYFYY